MPATQRVRGIVNGHWERSEPRSAWLLLLARMSVAELRMLSDWARAPSKDSDERADLRAANETAHEPVAAE